MADGNFTWAIKAMRAGYAGRGLTYLVVAGVSLWAIWHGGEAEGTSSAMARLEGAPWGKVALVLIGLGLLAYAVWRVICAIWDLEDYGSDGEGLVARAGQITTGVIHGALGVAAFVIVLTTGGGGDSSTVSEATHAVMSWPFGRWLVGLAGVVTVGAGLYYFRKGWEEKYRKHLIGNEFTMNWNWVLKAGVMAQSVVITIIGGFLVYAAWTLDAEKAGGLDGVWEFLSNQPFGNFLVILLCLGLLGFAVFCFVNAAYRVVPNAREDSFQTLAARFKEQAS